MQRFVNSRVSHIFYRKNSGNYRVFLYVQIIFYHSLYDITEIVKKSEHVSFTLTGLEFDLHLNLGTLPVHPIYSIHFHPLKQVVG